jgi:hypothetical protein
MIPHLYHFRPVDAVLDQYEELAKQEIYFAPPEKLNDPMEGYKDVFWSGDWIVWRTRASFKGNRRQHAALCVDHLEIIGEVDRHAPKPLGFAVLGVSAVNCGSLSLMHSLASA